MRSLPLRLAAGILLLVSLLATSSALTTPAAHALLPWSPDPWANIGESGTSSYNGVHQSPSHCSGTLGIPAGWEPGWVRVGGSSDPHTPIVVADGQVLDSFAPTYFANQGLGEMNVGRSNAFVTATDNTFNHFARDANVFVTVDKKSKNLLADGT